MKRGEKASAEQVVLKLRQIEVQTAQGKSLALACKETEIFEQRIDVCLKQEIFYSLNEARTIIGMWQNTSNRVRPHSSLSYRPAAPVAFPDLALRLPVAAAMPQLPNGIGPKYRSGQTEEATWSATPAGLNHNARIEAAKACERLARRRRSN